MNALSRNDGEENGEEIFLEENDIINEFDIDEEELPDAEEEGDTDEEEASDGADDSCHIFTGHTGTPCHPYHSEGLTCLTISSDSSLVLTGSSDGSVHVVGISNGKVVCSLSSHTDSVECAAFNEGSRRDNWRAATGGMDKKLIIWDQLSSPRCICEHEDGITCLQWLSGMRYIASGCLDGKVRIWDSLSGDCVRVLSGHAGPIQSIASSCNGHFLVSASLDGTARVFEIAQFH